MVDCFAQAVADTQREFVVTKIKVIFAKRFREGPGQNNACPRWRRRGRRHAAIVPLETCLDATHSQYANSQYAQPRCIVPIFVQTGFG